MRNCYSRPRNGAGNRRLAASAYIDASLKKMFNEQNKQNLTLRTSLPLKEYFQSAIKHCVRLAASGNVEAKRRLPEIFFRLALYYERGDVEYGIEKNLKRSNEFLELAINLESE